MLHNSELQPQRAPQSTPSMHQTPLYVLMTPELKSGELLTLPDGKLLKGIRGSVSIERNANHIVNNMKVGDRSLDFIPTAGAWIGDNKS